jgi:hypothetical protein
MRSRYQNRQSWRKLGRQFYEYGLWKTRVLQKHPRQMSVRHFVPPAFDAAVIAGLMSAPMGAAGVAASVAAIGAYAMGMAAVASREAPAGARGRYWLALVIIHHAWALGFLTAFGPNLASSVDLVANEYTYHYYELTVQNYFFDGDLLEVVFANPGRGRFFEDSYSGGTAAQYGVNPPNLTAPATFIDGTLILGGQIDNLVLTYDYIANQGGFIGNINFDEGTLLGQIPVGQRNGWTLAGLAGRPNPSVPQGYDHQISGECRHPVVPTSRGTWGALKKLYR